MLMKRSPYILLQIDLVALNQVAVLPELAFEHFCSTIDLKSK